MLMKEIRRSPHGLGMVELMVGITVGLIVAAGASLVAVNQITEHRRLMLETQVQQDLRSAADLLQQEMRRVGFRGPADLAVWTPGKSVGSLQELQPRAASANPYSPLKVEGDATTGLIVTYLYARQSNTTGIPADNEHGGFKWDKSSGELKLLLGVTSNAQGSTVENWQPITDTGTLLITDFEVEVKTTPVSVTLGEFCDQPCIGTACPILNVREVSFKIVGQAKHDAKVVRTLSGTERIRAEAVTGACP